MDSVLPAGAPPLCMLETMSARTQGSAVAFVSAAASARRGDDAALLELLGPVQLIGVLQAPPSATAPVAEDDEDGEWSFRTRSISHAMASIDTGMDLWKASIFPVRKAKRTFFGGTIIVGRAASSDVFIDHPSISKLHARIKLGADGTYTITDADSTNGTWVSTRKIADKAAPLPIGAKVKLGHLQFMFSRLDQTIALLRAP